MASTSRPGSSLRDGETTERAVQVLREASSRITFGAGQNMRDGFLRDVDMLEGQLVNDVPSAWLRSVVRTQCIPAA